MGEIIVKLCICHCGHVWIQEVEESPLCDRCEEENTQNIDWFNISLETLERDVKQIVADIQNFQK